MEGMDIGMLKIYLYHSKFAKKVNIVRKDTMRRALTRIGMKEGKWYWVVEVRSWDGRLVSCAGLQPVLVERAEPHGLDGGVPYMDFA